MKGIQALLPLVLSLLSFCAFSQNPGATDDVHAILVQGKKKSQIVYSGKDHSFTMDIPARSAKPSDVPGFITIDRQIIQATLVPGSRSGMTGNPTTAQEKDILTRYMNYELGYYKKKLRQNYSNLQSEWLTFQGRLYLLWYFDMPKDYKLVSRQIYFSTLFYDQVLDLNAPLFKTNDFAKARTILGKLAGTMKTYNKQVDVAALTKQLNK